MFNEDRVFVCFVHCCSLNLEQCLAHGRHLVFLKWVNFVILKGMFKNLHFDWFSFPFLVGKQCPGGGRQSPSARPLREQGDRMSSSKVALCLTICLEETEKPGEERKATRWVSGRGPRSPNSLQGAFLQPLRWMGASSQPMLTTTAPILAPHTLTLLPAPLARSPQCTSVTWSHWFPI